LIPKFKPRYSFLLWSASRNFWLFLVLSPISHPLSPRRLSFIPSLSPLSFSPTISLLRFFFSIPRRGFCFSSHTPFFRPFLLVLLSAQNPSFQNFSSPFPPSGSRSLATILPVFSHFSLCFSTNARKFFPSRRVSWLSSYFDPAFVCHFFFQHPFLSFLLSPLSLFFPFADPPLNSGNSNSFSL